ncbi:D-alanyl-D-alanine carboxypeptidase family protein [Psychromicrobium xiongbiense]|uniref:D-alanyl-D-alanine carboxypeptidase family protein n=1 Tax=Psychromicrobium xiongbiense TaxID=3051184 RepID=UPI002557A2C5|nr:hypothetical protein [Psychromicrobium sp. YIM S02556]
MRIRNRFLVLLALTLLLLSGCTTAGLPGSASSPAGFAVDWPSSAAGIMVQGSGEPLTDRPGQQPVPTASTAKVIMALTVLKKYPLALHEPGLKVAMTDVDVRLYDRYRAAQGTVFPVYMGMVLTEYDLLRAALLPSANNIADSLALWAFGSLDAYRQAAQRTVADLGMNSTQIGPDASGYDPATTSTVRDLTILAGAAMRSPVIADIVRQPSADLPGGRVTNTNTLLGSQGVIGLKTGTSPQARGVFLFAANVTLGGREQLVVGAVQGAGETSKDAMQEAAALLASLRDSSTQSERPMKGGTASSKVLMFLDGSCE